jgi:hypothetical protein
VTELSGIGDRTRAAPRARVWTVRSPWVIAVALLALAATAALLVRLPSAVHDFDSRASFNDRIPPDVRVIAGADGLAIDNEFALEAIKLVPPNSTFTVLMPPNAAQAKPYGIVPTTLGALPPYMQNLLLPARMVDPAHAQYLLCYACNTDPFDPHMTRLWQSPKGYVIGRLNR